MDPLTHTLVGANLAATRLGRTTRLAGAALVIGANLPDVDAIYYFTGKSDFALGFRRGWTHGILAIAVLPFLQTALLLLYDRLRPDPDRAARPGPLLALSALAIVTHPTLDWLNNYGMRWLMPFRGTWSYGDLVFIMDPWLWLILGSGWLAGRRPNAGLLAAWGFVTLALGFVVARRSPPALVIVATVAILLLVALLWRSRRERPFAAWALTLAVLYIGGRFLIHEFAERDVRRELARVGIAPPTRLMVSPHPIDPTRWEFVAQTAGGYRYGNVRWPREVTLAPGACPLPGETAEWSVARRHPSIRGFMTWVRFPWYEIERTPAATRVHVYDARYARGRSRGFGGAVVTLDR